MVAADGIISTISPYGAAANGLATNISGNLYYSDNCASATIRQLTPLPSFCSYSVDPSVSVLPVGGSLSIGVTTAAGATGPRLRILRG